MYVSSTETLGITLFYAVVEPRSSQKREIIKISNVSGTTTEYTWTISSRNLRTYGDDTQLGGSVPSHGVNAEVIISDNHNFLQALIDAFNDHEELDSEFHGVAGIDVLASRPSAASSSGLLYFATDTLVLYWSDGATWQAQSAGSVPDASTSVKGVGKTSVAPVSATDPIFVGDNDPRMMTENQKNDLTDGGFTTAHQHENITGNIFRERASIQNSLSAGDPVVFASSRIEQNEADASSNLMLTGAGSNQKWAQPLYFTDTYQKTTGLSTYLRYVGSPTDNLIFRIETDTAGEPSGTLAEADAIGTLSYTEMGGSIGIETVSFSAEITMNAATSYWLVVSRSGTASTVSYFEVAQSTETYVNGKLNTWDGASLTSSNYMRYLSFSYTGMRRVHPTLVAVATDTGTGFQYTTTSLGIVARSFGNDSVGVFNYEAKGSSAFPQFVNRYQYNEEIKTLSLLASPSYAGSSGYAATTSGKMPELGTKAFPSTYFLTLSTGTVGSRWSVSGSVVDVNQSWGNWTDCTTETIDASCSPHAGIIGTSKAIITYTETGGANAYAKVVTHSGASVLTLGARRSLSTAAGSVDTKIVGIAQDKALAIYKNSANFDFEVLDISSTTISGNTAVTNNTLGDGFLFSPYEISTSVSNIAYIWKGTVIYKLHITTGSITRIEPFVTGLPSYNASNHHLYWHDLTHVYIRDTATSTIYWVEFPSHKYDARITSIVLPNTGLEHLYAVATVNGALVGLYKEVGATTFEYTILEPDVDQIGVVVGETVAQGGVGDIPITGYVETTGLTQGKYYMNLIGTTNTQKYGSILGAAIDSSTFKLQPRTYPYIDKRK